QVSACVRWGVGYGVRLSAKSGEGGAGGCEGVHADAEPRNVVAARHTQQAENQNNKNGVGDGLARNGMQPAEVQHDDDGDKNPQKKKEFALCGEIGFAGFVDEFGNAAHGFVDGEIFQARVNHESESESEQTEEDAEEKKFVEIGRESCREGEEGWGDKIDVSDKIR